MVLNRFGLRERSYDSGAGRAARRAPRGAAQLDPPGRGRPRGAAGPSFDRGRGRAAAVAQENAELRPGQRDPQGCECFFRPGRSTPDKATTMTLVEQLAPVHGLHPVLAVLGIAASTCYGWRPAQRAPCERAREDAVQLEEIRAVHERSGGTYGSPRVDAMLTRRDRRVGRKRVERLMRTHRLQGAFLRRKWPIPRPGGTRARPRRRTWSTPPSPPPDRTGCGSRTRPGSPGEGVSGWPWSTRPSPTGSVGWRASDRCDTERIQERLGNLSPGEYDGPGPMPAAANPT